MVSLDELPEEIILSIFQQLSIRDILKLGTTCRYFHDWITGFLLRRVIIVPSNFRATNAGENHIYSGYTVVKSSPQNLKLLAQKHRYIQSLVIYDTVNGLITNWNDSAVQRQLLAKLPIQHLFHVSSLPTLKPHITSLELNLVHRDSIKTSDRIISTFGVERLSCIRKLIIFSNNFSRLSKFEELLYTSLDNGKVRLKLDELVIKTYDGVGSKQDTVLFIGPTSMKHKDFKMLNFNRVIELHALKHLELSIMQPDLQRNEVYQYHIFKFFFSFFNDLQLIRVHQHEMNEVESIFMKVMQNDFLLEDDLEDWIFAKFARPKTYQINYSCLKQFSVSAHTATNSLISQYLIRHFIQRTETISELSLSFDNIIWITSVHENLKKKLLNFVLDFYKQVIPRLKLFKDLCFAQNVIRSHPIFSRKFRIKFEKIYREITGKLLLDSDPGSIFLLIARSFNHMQMPDQFMTSISMLGAHYLPDISLDLSEKGDYRHESYINDLSYETRLKILLLFAPNIYQILRDTHIITPATFTNNPSLVLYLNNLRFSFENNKPHWHV